MCRRLSLWLSLVAVTHALSSKSCIELGWTPSFSYPQLCAAEPECYRKQNFAGAEAVCNNLGARLCTSQEIMLGLSVNSPCFNDEAAWSSSTGCGEGSFPDGTPTAVRVMSKSLSAKCLDQSTELTGVLCCGDNTEAEVIGYSKETCDGLQWTIEDFQGKFGEASQGCGQNRIEGSCSGLQTYDEAISFCGAVGARLCLAAEIRGLGTGSGCRVQNNPFWSGIRCANTNKVQTFGPEGYVCTSRDVGRRVRCCADVEVPSPFPPTRQPTIQGPPTPAPSRLPTRPPTRPPTRATVPPTRTPPPTAKPATDPPTQPPTNPSPTSTQAPNPTPLPTRAPSRDSPTRQVPTLTPATSTGAGTGAGTGSGTGSGTGANGNRTDGARVHAWLRLLRDVDIETEAEAIEEEIKTAVIVALEAHKDQIVVIGSTAGSIITELALQTSQNETASDDGPQLATELEAQVKDRDSKLHSLLPDLDSGFWKMETEQQPTPPSPAAATRMSSGQPQELSAGGIAGIVISCLIVVAVVVVVIICCCCKKDNKVADEPNTRDKAQRAEGQAAAQQQGEGQVVMHTQTTDVTAQDTAAGSGGSDTATDDGANMEPVWAQALFNFDAEHVGDIDLKKGDLIKVLEMETKWWKGQNTTQPRAGQVGMFPSNFVELRAPGGGQLEAYGEQSET